VNDVKTPIDDAANSNAIHFPAWQVAPVRDFPGTILFDAYSAGGSRKAAIDQLLSTKKPVVSDFVKLVIDKTLKPSANAYGPTTSEDPGEPIVAITASTFSFDDVFRSMQLFESNHVDCVVSSPTTSYTFSLNGNDVTVRGEGDLHDRAYSKYKRVVEVPSASNFRITIYPTQSFNDVYISNSPIILSGSLAGAVVAVTLLFLIYSVVEHRFEHRLMEAVQLGMMESRDDQIRNKKVYVRYISHEVLSCCLKQFD
jgi:hypothetical protein